MSNDKIVKFRGNIVKCVYDSETFKTYAVDVNTKEYPEIKLNKYRNVSIIGDLPDLSLGIEYEITASEEESKYGTSYKVTQIKRDTPKTITEIYTFLCEILTENQADVLCAEYPDIIDRVKENRLDDIDLSKLKGIKEKTFEKIKRKIIADLYLLDLVAEFNGVISIAMLRKIYEKYPSVELLRKKLKREPYTTLTRVSGIGFKKADGIVIVLQEESIIDFGYDVKTSVDRCLACVLYLLEENENNGHTKMNLADLRAECYKEVPECANHFTTVIKDEHIYYNKEDMDISLKETFDTEHEIAEVISNALKNNCNTWDIDITKYKEVNGFELSDEQFKAIENVCKYSISILNGSAGTGKTATTQAIIKMLNEHNKTFKLFAPTGKASKVLASYTNEPASTIHRGLGYMPPNVWTYNKEYKLSNDIIIVDEFSMVDAKLFKRLIDAINLERTKLLIIGDNAQLPSVGCGNLLHDFMQTNLIPTTTLTKVFRYNDGGLMRVATDTRNCKTFLDKSMKSKATTFGENEDYRFIDLDSEAIPKNVVALYKKLLEQGNSIEDIQVLTAKNVGDCGTVVLNNMIQKVANKNYGSEKHMKVGEVTYYKGDLILQKQNNYKAEIYIDSLPQEEQRYYIEIDETPTAFVANGETGIVEEINLNHIIINFDGIRVKYYRDDMNMIGLGYAMSIHKSQGSASNNIILCTPQSHTFMLNSNLIYVGLTRMRKKCYHLGTLNTVNMSIKKKENMNRHTFMQKMLLDMMK